MMKKQKARGRTLTEEGIERRVEQRGKENQKWGCRDVKNERRYFTVGHKNEEINKKSKKKVIRGTLPTLVRKMGE